MHMLVILNLNVFPISSPQVCLTNGLRERNKQQQQEQITKEDFFLNKPVEPKDLKLIYTLGPKPSTKTILCV